MTFTSAKKLHNNDEVTIKETKEIITVSSIEIVGKTVVIKAFTNNGWEEFRHTEVS